MSAAGVQEPFQVVGTWIDMRLRDKNHVEPLRTTAILAIRNFQAQNRYGIISRFVERNLTEV